MYACVYVCRYVSVEVLRIDRIDINRVLSDIAVPRIFLISDILHNSALSSSRGATRYRSNLYPGPKPGSGTGEEALLRFVGCQHSG